MNEQLIEIEVDTKPVDELFYKTSEATFVDLSDLDDYAELVAEEVEIELDDETLTTEEMEKEYLVDNNDDMDDFELDFDNLIE